jgi:anti-anti-sigma factor
MNGRPTRREAPNVSDETTHGLLDVDQVGDCTVARFTRRTVLDTLAVEAVGARLRDLVRDGRCRKLIVNFTQVESLTSGMVGNFVALHKEVSEAGGRLGFCCVGPFLSHIFTICRIPGEVPIYMDEAKALADLGAPPPAPEGQG